MKKSWGFFLTVSFILMSVAGHARATLFDYLMQSFQVAHLPYSEQIRGYWAGRCVHWSIPEQEWPSFYVYKTVYSGMGPQTHETQSYYTDNTFPPEKFDFTSALQIENDPALSLWRSDQQWRPIAAYYGSFINTFSFTGFPTLQREARFLPAANGNYILLKVSPWQQPGALPYSICYYQRFLGLGTQVQPQPNPNPNPSPVPVPSPIPVPQPMPMPNPMPNPMPAPSPLPSPMPQPTPIERFVFGTAKGINESSVKMTNLNPQEKINHLVFLHQGPGTIEIRNVQLVMKNSSLYFGEKIVLQAGVEKEIILGIPENFSSIRFRVRGQSNQLEVFGVRNQD